MTTRPILTPQRSLSTANPIQRPALPRSLSQTFSSSSPTRRGNEGFGDLTFDGDAAGAQRPRIGTSRLRVEVQTDSKRELVESPRHTPELPPSSKPRGRPQLYSDVPNSSSPRIAQERSQNDAALKPMPMPVRPGQHGPPISEKARSSAASSVKKDARPKPYVLEVPTLAPRYSPNGHADFFPWTGNHPEDQFSESIIRQGYYDKTQMTQNETGSAKPSIFPALKHKSGLQTLSSLFTSVLAQRRAHGQITSASTFKPPPRVTVTDTKREMWLKDLANPTISLRRLSRSIPHGIRGKVLLDQSLGKNIPIERAVWLAKCVGANELRSFRRKGVSGTFAMGGEAKWIRDFTVCVEQFLENIVGLCGEADFKAKINYAIRLATHFYAEHLLDREHYMDWLVSSLENSLQMRLPIWLLITQVYWKDLMQFRKYGRRLAAALLHHFAESSDDLDKDILAPLSQRLKALLRDIMTTNTKNFIAPQTWAKHRDMIFTHFADDEHIMRFVAAIDLRVNRLASPGKGKKSTPRQRLIKHLDAAYIHPFTKELAAECWLIDDDKTMLMHTVHAWCSSSYRPGNAKIYVAARLIRFWAKLGADITEAILNFLDSQASQSCRSKDAFYHLVSELARSEHFSTPRYLQWLIARGGLFNATDLSSDGPFSIRLLAELPIHNVSDSISDLRMTLLERAGFSADGEEERIKSFMISLKDNLPGTNIDLELENDDLPVEGNYLDIVRNESRTIKSELGLWLRHEVSIQMSQSSSRLEQWDEVKKMSMSTITMSDFSKVRQFLERTDDYSMLADILKLVTGSDDADVLASCADTLNLHIEIFAAIGALNDLFDTLLARLRAWAEGSGAIPRVFLVSLSDLASRMTDQKAVAQQLALDLARSDRKTAADACSPVSDHMAIVESPETDFTEAIEKVLASGNSMDQGTLERLFQRIVARLEESWDKSLEQQRSCNLLLTRLRTFDVVQFDLLMMAWVTHFLRMQNRPSIVQVFSPLISFGCVDVSEFIATSTSIDATKSSSTSLVASTMALQLYSLLIEPANLPQVMTVEEEYRFRIKQLHMQKDHPAETLVIIGEAFKHSSSIHEIYDEIATPAARLFEGREARTILRSLLLSNTEIFIEKLVDPLLNDSSSEVVTAIRTVIDELLLAGDISQPVTTEMLLKLADDFSLPFCQVKLASMFKSEDSAMEGAESSQSELLESFNQAIEQAVAVGQTSWASIIPLLNVSIAQHLRRRAECQFLALFPTTRTPQVVEDPTLKIRLAQAENLLHIVEATSYSQTAAVAEGYNLAQDIVIALNGICQQLAKPSSQESNDIIIQKWIPLLLSFTTLHGSTFEATKQGHEYRAKAILALIGILLQLQALSASTETITTLIEHTSDLALYLVDSLSEEMRQQCIRSLKETAASPQIRYLLSFAANPTEWLVLSQKERTMAALSQGGEKQVEKEKLVPFPLRRWEMLGEPTPNVGENDTSLSLTLFGARRG